MPKLKFVQINKLKIIDIKSDELFDNIKSLLSKIEDLDDTRELLLSYNIDSEIS